MAFLKSSHIYQKIFKIQFKLASYVAIYLLIHKAEKPSVCPSDCRANISVMSAWIEMGYTPNKSRVFWEHGVYFKKSICAITHPQKCAKGTGVI